MNKKSGIWNNKNFLILFSGQLVSTFGNNLYMTALPWYILVSTDSRFNLAVTSFADTLPVLAGLFVGVLVDRWFKLKTMVYSDIIRGVFAILMGLGVYYMTDGSTGLFMYLVVLVFFLELTGTVYTPAQMSLIPKIVKQDDLSQANGVNQSGRAFAQLAGSIAGGTLIGFFGAALLFILNGVSFLLSAVSLFFIRSKEKRPKKADASFSSMWKEGMAIIWQKKDIFRAIVSSIIGNSVILSLSLIVVAWVEGPMHGDSWLFGVMSGAELAGIMMGGIVIGFLHKMMKLNSILLTCFIMGGLALGLIGVFPNAIWGIAMMFFIGLCIGIFNSAITTLLMEIVPEDARGRVFATGGALTRLTAPIGIAIFGVLIVHLDLRLTFAISALFMFAGGLLYIRRSPSNEAEDDKADHTA